MRPKPPLDENLLGQRIRNRREARGLAAYALAQQVQISPSYLSLIENGTKVPSDDIATRLAGALDDDPELYRAWVQASRHPDLRQHLDRLLQVQSFRSSPEQRGRLRRGEQVEFFASRPPQARSSSPIRSALERLWLMERRPVEHNLWAMDPLTVPYESGLAETAALEIPLLPDGADPGEDPWIAAGASETIWLDRSLLPPDAELPFAYRPGPAMIERVRRAIEPGDLVVLAAFDGSIDPSRIYAVRQEDRIVLSRVVPHGSILLLPADEAGRPASIECRDEAELRERLAGVVVTTLRTFGGAGGRRPTGARPSGRSVRVEGDYLVRDTEWREPYGWRPVQRPEDVAWLEQHPGTKMRYRLIRDGRVRFLLEMSPDEWREALGRYGRSPSWERNGYVVAVTQRRGGDYSEDFQERWSRYVRPAAPEEEKV